MCKPERVLVAEDDPTDAFFLERTFSKMGVPVVLHFVRDGQEVVDYLRGELSFADRRVHPLPDLLLLARRIPGWAGFAVLKWLRQQPVWKRLRVFIFTSSGQADDINRAY